MESPEGNSGFPRKEVSGPKCVDKLCKDIALLKASNVGYIRGCVLGVWGHTRVSSQGRICVGVWIKHFSTVT